MIRVAGEVAAALHDGAGVEKVRDLQRSSSYGRGAEGYRIFGLKFTGRVNAQIEFATLDRCGWNFVGGTGDGGLARNTADGNTSGQQNR